jgi:flagellar hook assembly protein FlgD
LAKAGNTKIEIYNILGQRVATLLNKELGAGSHKVKFNGSNLSSGIYFYRLQSDNYSSIKKMILLK